MTRTLVLTNHKGGVGKSTSASNIAFGLVQVLRSADARNSRVLLVDTDSQGHATLVTTGSKAYGTHDSLYTVLTTDRKDAPRCWPSASDLATGMMIYTFYLPPPCWKAPSAN